MINLASIKQTMQSNSNPHLGDICFWNLSNANIDRATLMNIWPLDIGLLPEEVTPDTALRRAVKENALGLKDFEIKLGAQDEQKTIYAIVRVNRDGIGNVDSNTECKITLERGTGMISSDCVNNNLSNAVLASYNTLRYTHTADDVRRAIKNALDTMAAIPLRSHGGVYYVSCAFSPDLYALQNGIGLIGKSTFSCLSIFDNQSNPNNLGSSGALTGKTALVHAVQGSLESDLKNLQSEIAEWATKPPSQDRVFSNRIAEFEELRNKALVYETVLGASISELQDSINEAQKKITEMLDLHKNPDANKLVSGDMSL